MPRKGQQSGDDLTHLARKLVALHPDAPAKTLGRRLQAESNGALTLEQACLRIRYALGLIGKKKRRSLASVGGTARPPRQAGQVFAMPASKADGWEPHVLERHIGEHGLELVVNLLVIFREVNIKIKDFAVNAYVYGCPPVFLRRSNLHDNQRAHVWEHDLVGCLLLFFW